MGLSIDIYAILHGIGNCADMVAEQGKAPAKVAAQYGAKSRSIKVNLQ
jgi:hypothetical protein